MCPRPQLGDSAVGGGCAGVQWNRWKASSLAGPAVPAGCGLGPRPLPVGALSGLGFRPARWPWGGRLLTWQPRAATQCPSEPGGSRGAFPHQPSEATQRPFRRGPRLEGGAKASPESQGRTQSPARDGGNVTGFADMFQDCPMGAGTRKMGSPFRPPGHVLRGKDVLSGWPGSCSVASGGSPQLVEAGFPGGPHLARCSALPPFPLPGCPGISRPQEAWGLSLASGSVASEDSPGRG